jgi:autotransporter-associated beta strand protein
MKPKHVHFISALSLVLALPSAADVIYSNLRDIAIPATFAGVYLDIQTGNFNTNVNAPIFGWDINPFFGGSVLWNSPTFQPVRIGTNATDAVAKLEEGTMVGSSSVFSTFTQGPGGQDPGGPGYGSSEAHLGFDPPGRFVSGSEGYLGFRTSDDHYGWMRVVFTNNTGGAMIKEWAYDDSGAAISTANIKRNGATVTLISENGSFTVPSAITDSGGETTLDKATSGTVTLTGTNTFTGGTTVYAGTLLVNGLNNGGGSVHVSDGSTLGGTGEVTGALTVTGILSPGVTLGTFSSGALTMNPGGTFYYQAINNGATGADLMRVNGALSLTEALLDLNGADLGLNIWDLGDKLTLISYEGLGLTAGFTGYDDDTVYNFGSNQWLFNYNDSLAGGNFNLNATGDQFITLTVVPEPGAALLGSLGLLALLCHRRK